jgi:hypothetical protein
MKVSERVKEKGYQLKVQLISLFKFSIKAIRFGAVGEK